MSASSKKPRRAWAMQNAGVIGIAFFKALGREHMTLDQLEERRDGEGSVADLVGQRRQRQVDPLGLKAQTLAVEGDVHAELVEQDRPQQLRTDEAARRGMERCRGWLIFSQSGQVNFSRTVSISLNRRGISSSVSVTSSPSFASRDHRSRRSSLEPQ